MYERRNSPRDAGAKMKNFWPRRKLRNGWVASKFHDSFLFQQLMIEQWSYQQVGSAPLHRKFRFLRSETGYGISVGSTLPHLFETNELSGVFVGNFILRVRHNKSIAFSTSSVNVTGTVIPAVYMEVLVSFRFLFT